MAHEYPDNLRAACHQFDLHLAAHLEGQDNPQVAAHAKECPYCRALLADLEQIRLASRDLPLDEPPPRLWANICATLQGEGIIQEQIPAWQRWFPPLALLHTPRPVGALAGLALLAVALLSSPRGYESPDSADSMQGRESMTLAGVLPVGADVDLARTVKEMEETYSARGSFLEPALKETYDKSLGTLNDTIEECIRHCRREPRNALARQYLIHAYQAKAEVLASALESNR